MEVEPSLKHLCELKYIGGRDAGVDVETSSSKRVVGMIGYKFYNKRLIESCDHNKLASRRNKHLLTSSRLGFFNVLDKIYIGTSKWDLLNVMEDLVWMGNVFFNLMSARRPTNESRRFGENLPSNWKVSVFPWRLNQPSLKHLCELKYIGERHAGVDVETSSSKRVVGMIVYKFYNN